MILNTKASLAFGVILLVTPTISQASLLIDQFVVNQSVTTTAALQTVTSTATPGGLFVNTITNTSVVSADREMLVVRTSAGNQNRVVSLSSNSSVGGYLVLNSDPDTGSPLGQGLGEIVYETQQTGDSVISAFGAAPDVYTLGLNLLQYGNQFEIFGRAVGATGTTPVYVTLYGSGALSGQTASAQFNLSSTNTLFAIPLASFTGNTTILSNVGAIRVRLGGDATTVANTADVYLDYLSITGTPTSTPEVPEPATMTILGSGLLALAGLGRWRSRA
jgi:hypothetical protein